MTATRADVAALVDPATVRRLVLGVRATAGRTEPTASPLDGSRLAQVPQSSEADVDAAFAGARSAQPAWSAMPVGRRAAVLLRFHDLLLDHADELGGLIVAETGKTRAEAADEVYHLALTARYYGRTAARTLASRRRPGLVPGLTRIDVHQVPKGVVGVVSPWNYPLTMAYADGVAALVAGNTVVAKPDAQTMLTALRGREVLVEAGLPPDAWQVVAGPGDQVGTAIVDRADHVCFTGSTETGRTVGVRAASRLVSASLELGGKNPMIVCADADLSRAVEGAVRGGFGNAGQLCVSFERLYVADAVYQPFVDALVARTSALELRPWLGWACDVGTLTSAGQLAKVLAHVDDARARGARVLTGGRPRPDLAPYAYEPTLLEGVDATMACHREETFGPVVAVHRFADEDEAVRLANDSVHGLHASVWSRDHRRARALARRLLAGSVDVNESIAAGLGSLHAPMGGMRDSGLGRRQGPEGLLRFTEPQAVATQRLVPIAGAGGDPQAFAEAVRSALRVVRRTPRA